MLADAVGAAPTGDRGALMIDGERSECARGLCPAGHGREPERLGGSHSGEADYAAGWREVLTLSHPPHHLPLRLDEDGNAACRPPPGGEAGKPAGAARSSGHGCAPPGCPPGRIFEVRSDAEPYFSCYRTSLRRGVGLCELLRGPNRLRGPHRSRPDSDSRDTVTQAVKPLLLRRSSRRRRRRSGR